MEGEGLEGGGGGGEVVVSDGCFNCRYERTEPVLAGPETPITVLNIYLLPPSLPPPYRLVGLVVKASASRAEDPAFESHLRRDFCGVESYQ